MKQEPLDEQEPISTKNTVLNLLAIGGFLWLLLKSVKPLVYVCVKSIGIISGISPSVVFWTSQILSVAIMVVFAIILTRRIWQKYLQNRLNSKSQLIKLGTGIFAVQMLQFIYGLYIPGYLINHYQKSMSSYSDALNDIDHFGLVDISFGIAGTILLLLVFIKWK
jgi:glucan phosphoethanolaminetransferase (alkaline phosphatase superfamily)